MPGFIFGDKGKAKSDAIALVRQRARQSQPHFLGAQARLLNAKAKPANAALDSAALPDIMRHSTWSEID